MCTMSKMNPIKLQKRAQSTTQANDRYGFWKESACRDRRYKSPPDCLFRAALSCPLHADQVRRPDTLPQGLADLDSPE